jgi:hypothetical protein
MVIFCLFSYLFFLSDVLGFSRSMNSSENKRNKKDIEVTVRDKRVVKFSFWILKLYSSVLILEYVEKSCKRIKNKNWTYNKFFLKKRFYENKCNKN